MGSETTAGNGRILVNDTWVAYSYYASPVDFVEATAVSLDGNIVLGSQRVAIGPSEVLDLDGDRLLIGRPRAIESEPSADLWIFDLSELEGGP